MKRVLVADFEGDEPGEEFFLQNEAVVVVDGTAYVSHVTRYANGTHVITVKGVQT